MEYCCSFQRAAVGDYCYFGCFKGGSKSVQVMFSGMEAVMVLTLIILESFSRINMERKGARFESDLRLRCC